MANIIIPSLYELTHLMGEGIFDKPSLQILRNSKTTPADRSSRPAKTGAESIMACHGMEDVPPLHLQKSIVPCEEVDLVR
jgi:hypothetical protein